MAEAYGSDQDRKIILPGSFNPLHDGHLKLLEVAMRYAEYMSLFVISTYYLGEHLSLVCIS